MIGVSMSPSDEVVDLVALQFLAWKRGYRKNYVALLIYHREKFKVSAL